MSHLDRYEADGLDEDVEEVLEEGDLMAARRAAEAELNKRDKREGIRRGGRTLPGVLAGGVGSQAQVSFRPCTLVQRSPLCP